MRLLERNADGSFNLRDFTGKDIPAYAILSHTWHEDNAQEVIFQDVEGGTAGSNAGGTVGSKAGWKKLEFCADRSEVDGLRWFWIDTCCIDTRNAVELSTAINSMFRWYQKAARCYVYLSDVTMGGETQKSQRPQSAPAWESAFRGSRWFSRGWTLQELVAPTIVDFYSSEGRQLGTRDSLKTMIAEITGISEGALSGESLSTFSIKERESWAISRKTTIEEDAVYSLLGIFDVTMPLIYGEGKGRAYRRLHREIYMLSGDRLEKSTCYLPFPRNTRFTGRSTELQLLKQKLLVDKVCNKMALVGLGGVGKTQIALSLAYHMKETYPEYFIFWLPALSMETFEQACGEVARRLQLVRAGQGEQEDVKKLVKEELSNEARGKWFLIIDNADSYDLVCGTQQSAGIMDYLPESEHGLIVFTTRHHDVAQVACSSDVIEVESMDPDDAMDFLRRSIARQDHLDDLAATKELLAELAYLPLAISQAVGYINTKKLPMKRYLKMVKSAEQELVNVMSVELRDNWRYRGAANAVASTWIVSFEEIRKDNPDAADLLAFLSCIEWKAIPHSILPVPSSGAPLDGAIGTLCSYSFVTRREDGEKYDMHRLVHLATRIWLQRSDRVTEIKRTAVKHLADVFPSDDYRNREIWRAYLPHVVQMNKDAEDTEDKSWLCLYVGNCLLADGRRSESVGWLEDSYRLAVMLPEESRHRLSVQHHLAMACRENGGNKRAVDLLERVVAIHARIHGEDHKDRLASQHELAVAYYSNGQYKEATEILERIVAIKAIKRKEDHPSRLASQHALAAAYLGTGQVKEATELLERVVAVRTKVLQEDDPDRLASQHALATAYHRNGQVKNAIELLERVVAIEAQVLQEEDPSRLLSQHALAIVYEANGQVQEAIELHERVVSIEARVLQEDHPDRLASEHQLAYVYALHGRPDEAFSIITQVVRRKQASMATDHPSRVNSEKLLEWLINAREDGNQVSDLSKVRTEEFFMD